VEWSGVEWSGVEWTGLRALVQIARTSHRQLSALHCAARHRTATVVLLGFLHGPPPAGLRRGLFS
jgi:hypothetical protein